MFQGFLLVYSKISDACSCQVCTNQTTADNLTKCRKMELYKPSSTPDLTQHATLRCNQYDISLALLRCILLQLDQDRLLLRGLSRSRIVVSVLIYFGSRSIEKLSLLLIFSAAAGPFPLHLYRILPTYPSSLDSRNTAATKTNCWVLLNDELPHVVLDSICRTH